MGTSINPYKTKEETLENTSCKFMRIYSLKFIKDHFRLRVFKMTLAETVAKFFLNVFLVVFIGETEKYNICKVKYIQCKTKYVHILWSSIQLPCKIRKGI